MTVIGGVRLSQTRMPADRSSIWRSSPWPIESTGRASSSARVYRCPFKALSGSIAARIIRPCPRAPCGREHHGIFFKRQVRGATRDPFRISVRGGAGVRSRARSHETNDLPRVKPYTAPVLNDCPESWFRYSFAPSSGNPSGNGAGREAAQEEYTMRVNTAVRSGHGPGIAIEG